MLSNVALTNVNLKIGYICNFMAKHGQRLPSLACKHNHPTELSNVCSFTNETEFSRVKFFESINIRSPYPSASYINL